MTDRTNDRKLEHIRAIEHDPTTDRDQRYFDRIRLTHRALPELALADIKPQIEFLERQLSFPLLISSMTGGDHELICKINRNLAEAAQRTGVAMAVGSQRVMFTNQAAEESFRLRELAPDVPLIANLGAVQLNCGLGIRHAMQAVDILEADALYLHLNPLQEAVQPEGDTDFRHLTEEIGTLVETMPVPVLLKEVGAGLSPSDIKAGLSVGVKYFDLAGSGGLSWSRVEHHRNPREDDLGLRFQDWGIPTPLALKLAAPYKDQASFIASGGVRDGIDMAKAVILGASLCGMAGPFLKPAMESADAVVAVIERLRREFVTAMFLLGAADFDALYRNQALVLEEY